MAATPAPKQRPGTRPRADAPSARTDATAGTRARADVATGARASADATPAVPGAAAATPAVPRAATATATERKNAAADADADGAAGAAAVVAAAGPSASALGRVLPWMLAGGTAGLVFGLMRMYTPAPLTQTTFAATPALVADDGLNATCAALERWSRGRAFRGAEKAEGAAELATTATTAYNALVTKAALLAELHAQLRTHTALSNDRVLADTHRRGALRALTRFVEAWADGGRLDPDEEDELYYQAERFAAEVRRSHREACAEIARSAPPPAAFKLTTAAKAPAAAQRRGKQRRGARSRA